eukprot:1177096-Prorocentrum_minimum.AAC.2
MVGDSTVFTRLPRAADVTPAPATPPHVTPPHATHPHVTPPHATPPQVDVVTHHSLPDFIRNRGGVSLKPGDGVIHSWLNRMLLPDTVGTGGDSHTRFPIGISFPAGSGLVAFGACPSPPRPRGDPRARRHRNRRAEPGLVRPSCAVRPPSTRRGGCHLGSYASPPVTRTRAPRERLRYLKRSTYARAV